MSTGGTFTLIVNSDDRAKGIMQYQQLLDKLNYIKQVRMKHVDDLATQINNINKQLKVSISPTEIQMLTNKLASLTNEFNLINENLKQFITPSFDDIEDTHLTFLNSIYKPFIAIGTEYSISQIIGRTPVFGETSKFSINNFGDFVSDMVLYLKIEGLSAVSAVDRVKYCNRLGHRLMSNVSFEMFEVIIDQYNTEDYNNYYEFNVPANKRFGWNKCMGQENILIGSLTQDPLVDSTREVKYFTNGNQTLKRTHDVVELSIPLLFWFNTDLRNALYNKFIPFQQTRIGIAFENINKLVACANYGGSGTYRAPIITTCDLYTNHIFVNQEISDIYSTHFKYNMVRLHKSVSMILNRDQDQIKLDNLKWLCENLVISFRPTANDAHVDIWNKNCITTLKQISYPISYIDAGTETLGFGLAQYYDEAPVIDNITLDVDTVKLYDSIPRLFLNAYLPLKILPVNTPLDDGILLISFDVAHDVNQPTGIISLSPSKKITLSYESNYISPANTVRLTVSTMAINYLLFVDGTLQLAYVY